MSKTKEFIAKAISVHGDKYDYSKVKYINCKSKVIIICSEHGEFQQTPTNHLSGNNCKKCSLNHKNKVKIQKFASKFINRAVKIHNNKYIYDKVIYKHNKEKILVKCLNHGYFKVTPDHHLQGTGCPKCGGRLKSNTKDFIKKAKLIHGDKYNYDKVDYTNRSNKLIIVCKKHGEFKQIAGDHLCGKGCRKCSFEQLPGHMTAIARDNPNVILYLYHIKFENEEGIFYKIGLSKNVNKRMYRFPKNLKPVLLEKIKGKASDLVPLEKYYHNLFKELEIDYYPEELKGNGKMNVIK
jgi:hypothetical protein